MPVFSVTGDVDPFLHVALKQGDKIYCESDAMVMMEATLDLRGKMTGGIKGALMRRFANEESFFQQHIEAVRGDGDCLLSPTLPGAMQVVDVGARQYLLSDGAFVAASAGTEMTVRTQGIGNALLAQSGGFFVMATAGTGQVVVSGFGSMFALEVAPGKDIVIDNAHVVCWDSALRYEVAVATGGGAGGVRGMIGNLVNSVTSGEGLVLRFSCAGPASAPPAKAPPASAPPAKVYVCSRNRQAFLAWTAGGRGA